MTAKKHWRWALAAAAAFITLTAAPIASAQDRYAAIVMDARSGEVLLADQADELRFPASLTKMMTLYLLFEALDCNDVDLGTTLIASPSAAQQPRSRLGLRVGDTITVEQAIRALVVESANDVAYAISEKIGGNEAQFAQFMNDTAAELGMTRTRFVNASGLPDIRQRTTARDMAILARALWRDHPNYYAYFQTPTFTWAGAEGRNHNRLLGRVDGLDGIKTGYTRASGFNVAASVERNDQRLIVVVMGGASASGRDAQASYLIETAFEEYARRDNPDLIQAAAPARTTVASAPRRGEPVGQGDATQR